DVGGNALAGSEAALGAQAHGHLAESVLAPGHGADRVVAQLALGADRLLNRLEDRVDGTVAARLPHRLLPRGQSDGDAGQRLAPGTRLDLEPAQLVGVGALTHLVGDDRL